MQELPPEYLSEIARQIAFVSAFLGGFAATYLGTLLSLGSERRVLGWSISGAAVAASAFIVAVIALTMLMVSAHPGAPTSMALERSVLRARVVGFVGFVIGLYALLISIGCSGWLRSRSAGLVTSGSAALAALLATWALLGF